jgi:Zn-dependent M28 family amino/carboxypeptidase
VIAVLPGTAYKTAQDEVIILAAHIDTFGRSANGVNNDGTGLVALLAIAEDLTGI